MRIKSSIFLLLFFCSLIGPAGAEEVISWPDCVRAAKENHPELLASLAAITQAAASKNKTRGDLLPRISGNLSARRSKSSGEEAVNSYSYGLSGQQLIFDGLKSWRELDRGEQDLIVSRLDYELSSADIRRDLRTAFVNLLRTQELIRITEEIARRRRQQLELVRLRYQGGREHRGSLLTAEANLAAAEFDIDKAHRDLRVARRQLLRQMGREDSSPLRAEGSLDLTPGPDGLPDYRRLMENHPAVLRQVAQKESARLEVEIARGDFLPDLYGTASLGRSDDEWPPRDEQWTVGLALSLPLFQGGSRFSEITRAKGALREAEEKERDERDAVRLQLEESWTDLRNAAGRVAVQKKFLQAGEERARIAQAQYATGLLSFDNWIIIEDDLVRTKKTYLASRADALIAEAQWISARGGTLDFK